MKIPDLWPKEVDKLDAVTPLTILREQVNILNKRTLGKLEAKIVPESGPKTGYKFLITAPSIRYTFELFAIEHDKRNVYPVKVFPLIPIYDCTDFELFLGQGSKVMGAHHNNDGDILIGEAHTTAEFINLLSIIFKHRLTKAALDSIVAAINEKNSDQKQA